VEFHSQGNRLKALDGKDGKLDIETCIRGFGTLDDLHQLRTTAVSLSQATEVGTFYSADELLQLAGWAKGRGVAVHMDGTRFANVVVATGSTPAELSWRAGVDVLCLGATKGGAIGAEIVVFFDRELADDFKRLMKRSGHLASRLWFLAAQLEAYFSNDLWKESARHANAMACRLGNALSQSGLIAPQYPVQTNMVFLKATTRTYERLRECGFKFYLIEDETEGKIARFVTSHATNPDDVETLSEAIISAGSRS
jgi:threonine aldolase